MACESETATVESTSEAAVAAFASPDASVQDGVVCNCQFCGAVSLLAFAAPVPSLPVPSVASAEPASLLGVQREPLVPPPQLRI